MSEPTSLKLPNTTRIEAFSDGVLAIIITLLVLEISVPQLHNASSVQEAWHALGVLLPKFLSFVLSFVFVAVFWVNHHQFFHLVRHADRWLLWLNNLLLLTLSFVPFPTAFIGDYPQNAVALALFAVVLMAAGLSFNLMWRYARQRKLFDPAVTTTMIERAQRRGLIGPVCYSLAALLSFVFPVIAWIIFVLVPVFYFLPMSWGHRTTSPGQGSDVNQTTNQP